MSAVPGFDKASVVDSTDSETDQWPEPPEAAAFHGLAGDVVRAIEPTTEADPVAILTQFIVTTGCSMGRGAHWRVEGDRHYTNENLVLVGDTSHGRKGTSFGRAREIVLMADPTFEHRIQSGLSSGEGMIAAVRDPVERQEPKMEKGEIVGHETVMVDPGVADKRAMFYESEFAGVLKVATRDGNTLSAKLRDAWDGRDLQVVTKNSPHRASNPHISIISHIGQNELLRHTSDTEAANGFLNRYLWASVRRSKCLPEGGRLPFNIVSELASRTRDAIAFGRAAGELNFDDEARRVWHAVYPVLSEGAPGLMGAMTARAEAHVMRLALLYAVLDQSPAIKSPHLLASLALWEYCRASARFIFGDALGDPVADAIWDALKRAPDGLSRTDLSGLFGRNKDAAALNRALATLSKRGLAAPQRETTTAGRPAERWFASRLNSSIRLIRVRTT